MSTETRARRLGRWLPAVIGAGFVMAGFFKSIPALAFLPVDLTFGFAALTAGLIAHRLFTAPIPPVVHGVVVGFVALIPPALLFPATTDYGSEKVLRLFSLTFLAALAPVVLIRDAADVRRFVWAWTGWCAVVVGSALTNPQSSATYEGAPVTAEGVNTIGLGVAAGLVFVVMVVGLIWRYVPWFVAVPAGACAIYVLLQSGSRGPLIAVVVAVVVAVVLVRTRPLAVRTTAVLALVAAGLVVAYDLAPYYARQRVADLLFRGEVSANQNARTGLFETAVNSIASHPFGIGWGNFENLGSDGNTYPHNIVLEALAEAGLIFGGIFLAWVAVSVWRARQASTGPVGAIAFALVVFLLTAATSTGDINDNRTFFYALGIAVAGAGAAGVSAFSRPASSRREEQPPDATDLVEEPAPTMAAGERS